MPEDLSMRDQVEMTKTLSDLEFIRTPRLKWTSLTLSTLEEIFMPLDWRTSCTPDYLPYQFYDSCQAIFSSVAGLLATRESLVTLGVSRADASVGDALWLSVASETVSRAGSILFAWRHGHAFNSECKAFRFLADLLNDAGMILGTVSSAVTHPTARAGVVVLAGLLRALCGVCAGASKAALTNHFAIHEESVADINAKDGSQETVVYLIGLLLGAGLVPLITTRAAIWCSLLILVALHLFANYRAVKSVELKTLNRRRFSMVLDHYFDHDGEVLTPDVVAREEHLLVPQHSRFNVVWITEHNLKQFLQSGRTSSNGYDEDEVIVVIDDAGRFGVTARSGACHLDIMEAIFKAGAKVDRHDEWPIFVRQLRSQGWNLDSDALVYNGLRFNSTTLRKDQ